MFRVYIDDWPGHHGDLVNERPRNVSRKEQMMPQQSARNKRVSAVALQIHEAEVARLEIVPYEEVQATNRREGWDFDGPSSSPGNNNWVHYSGVRLADDELQEAYNLAVEWGKQ